MKNKRQKLEFFPMKTRNRLQLIWRYFQNIVENSDESNRFALFKASPVEIRGAYQDLKDQKESKIAGKITNGFFIHDDDFVAIHSAVSELLKDATEIIEFNMDLPCQ